MPDYQNGKIYKLVNTEGTLTYIGSTCQALSRRKAKHHDNYKCWKNGKYGFVTSFRIFDDDEDGCQIILLEAFPCSNRNELEKRERHFIESMHCVNKNRPTRTIKEWIDENKEDVIKKKKEYYKEYYEDNKDIINLKKNQKHNCLCGSSYTLRNKSQHMKSLKHHKYLNSIKTEQDELDKLEAEFNKI